MAHALVSGAVKKLSSILEAEVTLFAGARRDLEKLKETFESIQAVLDDVESRQVTETRVQLWLARLRNVAYDIGDVVDQWETSNDGGDDDDDDDCVAAECLPSSFACLDHIVSCFEVANRIKDIGEKLYERFEVAHRIKDIREKLDEVYKDKENFQVIQSSGSFGSGDGWFERSRTLTSSRIQEEMIGRGEDKETVISNLVSESSSSSGDQDGRQVHVIAIVGIGGLGKTTLAREICHDSRVQSHFSKVLWVCVSEPFDVINITKAILEDLEKKKPDLSQLNPLQNKLEGALKGERFLLVLDDVWNENEERWSQLRASLTAGAPGSRMLVTTRIRKVANVMSPAHIHDLKGLSDDHSWTVFSKRAFAEPKEECSDLESIGREIVRKCKGVPLSLKVIGSAMNTKSSAADWQNILDSKIWSLPEVTKKVLPALLLSYYNLPPHLKQCFLYCSVYQKDAEMDKDELVRLWIVQGFVQWQGNREVGDIGAEYVQELVALSMFQEVEKDHGGRTRCKMHDLLHDLAEFITKDETYIFTCEQSNPCPKNVRHASLFLRKNNPRIPVASLQAEKLRTLFLDGVGKIDATLVDIFRQAKFLKALLFRAHIIESLPEIIGKLKHLRYLDLSGTRPPVLHGFHEEMYLEFPRSHSELILKLPDVIGKLKLLSYMDLSSTGIVELPESVACLRNLHTLKLNDCRKLKKLPRGIARMVSLRHLEIKGTERLECLPKGLGRITSLITLSKFIVGGEGGCGIDELQQLNSLEGDLVIQNLERVSSGEEARRAELWNKKHLSKVVLEMKERDEEIATSERDAETERMDGVFEGLRPPADLEWLKLDCNRRSSKLPSWMGDFSFSKLTVLEIVGFIQCEQNNLPGIGKLPALTCLAIRNVGVKKVAHESFYRNSGNDVDGGRRGAAFPKLKHLVLLDIELGEWELTLEAFLQLWHCCKLEGQPDHLANAPLRTLLIGRCHGIKGTGCFSFPLLEEFRLIDSSEFFSNGLPHLPKLKKFYMGGIRKETLPDGGWESLVELRNLEIEACNELKSLPDGLAQLQSLENLKIKCCNKLESLPKGLGQLKKLQSLRISGLKAFTLRISGLEALTFLPDSLGQLEALENLKIKGCRRLRLLPEGLGQLKKLKSLKIIGAEALTCLPTSLGQLQSLEVLHMDGLKKLQSLPEDGMGQLKKLKSLTIGGAEALTCLPNSLGQLESLERLYMYGLKKLEFLPEEFGQLKKLKSLTMGDLEVVTCLPNWLGRLESLEYLQMNGWKKLESLPDSLGRLKQLEAFEILNCAALRSLPDLPLLRWLRIEGCPLLSERYKREGGVDWHRISHITDIFIDREQIKDKEGSSSSHVTYLTREFFESGSLSPPMALSANTRHLIIVLISLPQPDALLDLLNQPWKPCQFVFSRLQHRSKMHDLAPKIHALESP